MINEVVDSVVSNILPYCSCKYTSEYIKPWYVKCRQNFNDGTSDVILIAQLMPTNLLDASYVMQAMSKWVTSSSIPAIVMSDELLRIDQNCRVQIEHPYGKDCTEMLQTTATTETPTTTTTETPTMTPTTAGTSTAAQNQLSSNNDDDDNNSAGAAVGGVIAGLVIICITIVVLVVVVMLLRRREKQ